MATDSDSVGGEGGGRGGAFTVAPDPILVLDDRSGAVTDANDAAVDLFGRSRERLREATPTELWSTADDSSATAVFDRAADGARTTVEAELPADDGAERRWVEVVLEPAPDAGEVFAFVRDLTGRHELELELHHERGVTERVLDTVPTGIVVHDADGEITMANEQAETALALETSDLSGRRYDDPAFDLRTVDGEPVAPADYPFARIERTGEAVAVDHLMVETPGDERVLSVSGAPLWDDAGAFDGAVMAIEDVTPEFANRTRVRRQRDRLETLVEHLPVVLFSLDPEGRFTFSEGRGLERLGLESGDLEGESVFDVYADNPSIVDACERALDGETVRTTQEAAGRVFDTQYRPIVDDDGTVEQVIGVSLDVTDQVENERRLETLLDAIPAGVFMTRLDGEIEFMNDHMQASLAVEEDPAGRPLGDVLPAEQLPDIEDHHDAAVEQGGPVEREYVAETPDGERTIRTVVSPVSTTAGDVYAVVGVSRDITDRVEYERRLEENDAILSQLTETTDDAFWLFDGDFQELLFVNDAYEDIWGQPVEALRTDPMEFMKGVHPDDREEVQAAMARVSAGESVSLGFRVNPDEEFGRWVSVSAEPVFEDGEVVRVAGISRDITGRKRRERDLERSERQFGAVFNDPQLLVGLLDTEGRIQRVNDTALEYAPADRADIEGTEFAETGWWSHDPDLRADVREWVDRAADGEYVEFEATHPRPGGGEVAVEGTIRPVTDADGTVTSLIASSRDVTERVERERQLAESNERLEKFAYVASHDLQEPLRTVSNYVELLADEYADALDEEGQRFVDVAVTGSQRMQSMINGLLDYSRVTTRGEAFEPVDSEAVVDDAMDDIGVMLEEREGGVEWGDLPAVDADRDQFRRLFQNLVTNAFEHGGDGRIDVEISATDAGDAYRFAVADDGAGIAENRQEKIFRIFKSGTQYQTSSQAKGIGLAVCDNIVQRHGGEIWVESEPDEGATFHFTIPKPEDDR